MRSDSRDRPYVRMYMGAARLPNQFQCIGKRYMYYFVSGGNLTDVGGRSWGVGLMITAQMVPSLKVHSVVYLVVVLAAVQGGGSAPDPWE